MDKTSLRKSFFNICAGIAEVCIDMIYPKYCINCGKMLYPGKRVCICDRCSDVAGKMPVVFTDSVAGCDEIISALKYDGKIREAMLKFKFVNIEYLGYTFAVALADAVRGREFLREADFVTAVPIHVSRDREYNQSEVIARHLCSELGLRYADGVIFRVKPIDRLSSMAAVDKAFYIQNSYSFNPLVNLTGKTVIIVDDVMTTGTTLGEVVKEFRKHGAKHIYVLTACYSKIQ